MNWKIALALSALAAAIAPQVAGCTGDECTRADDQVANCSPPTESPPASQTSVTYVCAGTRLCQAGCINNHTCAEINASLCYSVTPCADIPGPLSAFDQCMIACQSSAGTGDAGAGDAGAGDAP